MASHLLGVALISGAASGKGLTNYASLPHYSYHCTGIGRGTALQFAEEGCTKIFLGDINVQGLEETETKIKSAFPATTIQFMKVDIADEGSVQLFINGCVEAFGRIDYALNIAGVVPQRIPILDLDVATYDRVIGINEYGVSNLPCPARIYSTPTPKHHSQIKPPQTWLCHRAQIRQMLQQPPLAAHGNVRGSIVTVSSLAGLNASAGMSPYSASKASVIGFAKTDAQDYGPHGIRINVVCPGMTDTALFRQTSPQDAPAKLAGITPLRRLGQPRDVGMLLAFLSSTKASFIQGAVVPVDGGLGLQRGVI
jgi:NAD(P)-dependent dehydrogenase (short-subunit alcohol dehydrogenase family)